MRVADYLADSWVPDWNGYLFLELEPYGFDTHVYVVVQPRGGFADYNECDRENYITRVSVASWDYNKFYIPAEYDVFIYFTPHSNSELSPWAVDGGSNSGAFQVRA